MSKIMTFLCIVLFLVACKNQISNNKSTTGVHKAVAKEIINTMGYTYVLLSESGNDVWIAIPKTEIQIGKTYYYRGGMIMDKFESKELKKTFESVLFLEGLSDNANNLTIKPESTSMNRSKDEKHTNINTNNLKKVDIKINPQIGGTTVAELYEKKNLLKGKKIKVTGQVTKFSPDIMKKNWVHVQDGSMYDEKFDLTITTNVQLTVGDTVTFEGKISINKDFGYGYLYEVLMEDAIIVN